MAVWGAARIAVRPGEARGEAVKASQASSWSEAQAFATGAAAEALLRLDELSPQSLSNICWALVTLELTGAGPGREVLLSGAAHAAPRLDAFPPQAVANLCWALGWVGRDCWPEEMAIVHGFAACAAYTAAARWDDFDWQDFSILAVALARMASAEGAQLVAMLVPKAVDAMEELNTQALLNILLSAVRLSVDHELLAAALPSVASCIESRKARLNHTDLRQWQEVRRGVLAKDGDARWLGRCRRRHARTWPTGCQGWNPMPEHWTSAHHDLENCDPAVTCNWWSIAVPQEAS